MARNKSGGWQLAGELLALGVTAGAAFYLHSKIEEATEQLLAKPQDEALKELAGSVPRAEDEVWQLIHDALGRRASTSRRAAELLAVAEEVRRMGPQVLQLVAASFDQGSQMITLLAGDLGDYEWNMLCLMLDGMSEKEPHAASLLNGGILIRGLLKIVDSLLEIAPQDQPSALVNILINSTKEQQNALLLALAVRARTSRDVEPLLAIAQCLPDAITLASQLITLPSVHVEAKLLTIAMEEVGWVALSAVLNYHADEDEQARQALRIVCAVHEALCIVDELLRQSMVRAKARMESVAHDADRSCWLRITALLAQKAKTDRAARALLETAEQINRARHVESRPQLLTSPASAPQSEVGGSGFAADILRQSLRMALADNVISPEEGAMLEQLRRKLNITDETARRVFQEIRAEVA